jgi:hypothetical protein
VLRITVAQVQSVAQRHPEAQAALRALAPEAFPAEVGGVLTLEGEPIAIVRSIGCFANQGWHLLPEGSQGPITWTIELDELGAQILRALRAEAR